MTKSVNLSNNHSLFDSDSSVVTVSPVLLGGDKSIVLRQMV